jgi:uncharacterized damage-inducible protein DinB
MPGTVPPFETEKEGLLAYLAQQRYYVKLASFGLNEEQIRRVPGPGALSIGGIIKHLSGVEEYWVHLAATGESRQRDPDAYADAFRVKDGESLESLLGAWADVAAATEKAVADLSLDGFVPAPKDAPWFQGLDGWSVRWVLLHLIQETARHAGHADIVREAIDGATAFPLMAAAENWPPAPWLQPWEPPAAD